MILDLLFLVIPFLAAVLGFPVFGAKYGEHWEIIQLLSLFFMNVYFWLDMSMRITHFAKTEYLFYKSVGLSSGDILIKYFKTNARFIYLFCGLCFVCIYDEHPVENVIAWLQWVILTVALTLLVYELLHLKSRVIFGIGGIGIACTLFVLLIVEVVQSGATGMNRWSLHLISNIGIMKTLKDIFLEVNMIMLMGAIVLFLLTFIVLNSFDDKIIDGLKAGSISQRFLKKKRDNKINPGKSRYVLELKRLVNLKAYVGAVILEYVFTLLGIILSLKLDMKIVWWFYIFAALGGLLAEAFYTLDIPSKLLYRLLGLGYREFFKVKLVAVAMAEVPVILLFILGMLLGCISMLELLMVVLMLVVDVFFINAFYSSKYLNLKYKNGMGYVIESIIVGIAAFIPVVNLVAGIVLYRKAEERWKAHVGD